MSNVKILILLVLLINSVATACPLTDGDRVRLTGKVSLETFPGRPNYESIAKGDEREDYWILTIDDSQCFSPDGTFFKNEISENRFQLGLRKEQFEQLAEGKIYSITGTTWAAHTGHHKTRVGISVEKIYLSKPSMSFSYDPASEVSFTEQLPQLKLEQYIARARLAGYFSTETNNEIFNYFKATIPEELERALRSSGNMHNPVIKPLERNLSEALKSTTLFKTLSDKLRRNNLEVTNIAAEKFWIGHLKHPGRCISDGLLTKDKLSREDTNPTMCIMMLWITLKET